MITCETNNLRVKEQINKEGRQDCKMVAERLGLSVNIVYRALARLANTGQIVCVSERNNRKWYHAKEEISDIWATYTPPKQRVTKHQMRDQTDYAEFEDSSYQLSMAGPLWPRTRPRFEE